MYLHKNCYYIGNHGNHVSLFCTSFLSMKHTTQADTTFFFFLNILLSAQFIARYRVVENVRLRYKCVFCPKLRMFLYVCNCT